MPPISKSRSGAALPLPTLLSHLLVAFTIEFDNEFERQMPHRTTNHGATAGSPNASWLVSLVMWSNFMRFIPEEGIPARELLVRTGLTKDVLRSRLQRMARWWGYIIVTPAPAGKKSLGDWLVRPSANGLRAQQIWRSLFPVIERRWQERFGKQEIARLRESLSAVVSQLDMQLPEYLPMLGAVWTGWCAEVPDSKRSEQAADDRNASATHLSALLARTLLAFTLDFEQESELSLAVGANTLRVLNDTGTNLRDLPRLAGVSKEAIKMLLGFLAKHRYILVEPHPAAARTKRVRITSRGLLAQDAYRRRLAHTEDSWNAKFGIDNIRNLRDAAQHLVGEPTAQLSPLFSGLRPDSEGWRASLPAPETLPHYPLVLHRGGYPDGS